MKAAPDCVPCILRQVLATARKVNEDPWIHKKVLNEVMQGLVRADLDCTPAELVTAQHRAAMRPLGSADPFAEEKKAHATAAGALEKKVRAALAKSADPLKLALRVAGAANVLDAAVFGPVDLAAAVEKALAHPTFAVDDSADFAKDLATAKSVLVLADSSGEAVFDRILLEQLAAPERTLLYAVKKGPVLNDAVREDAEEAGIPEIATVIDTGSDELGAQLGAASQEFRQRFEQADLVLSKGAANFETIAGEAKRKYFLLSVKCNVVARHFGVAVGDVLFMRE